MRLKTGTFDLTNEGGNKENKIEQKIPLHSIYMQKCNKDRINKQWHTETSIDYNKICHPFVPKWVRTQ